MQLVSAIVRRFRRQPPTVVQEDPPPRPLRPWKSYAQEIIDGMSDDEKRQLEWRVYDAYFRRFGQDAPQPCCGYTEFTEHYGAPTIIIGNARDGLLARYKIGSERNGKRRLSFTD